MSHLLIGYRFHLGFILILTSQIAYLGCGLPPGGIRNLFNDDQTLPPSANGTTVPDPSKWYPDLRVTKVKFIGAPKPGKAANYTVLVRAVPFIPSAPVPSEQIIFRASSDIPDDMGSLVTSSWGVPLNLLAEKQVALQGVVPVGSSIPDGTYEVCVAADPDQLTPEKDHTNNVACASANIIHPPQLDSAVSLGTPSNFKPGTSILLTGNHLSGNIEVRLAYVKFTDQYTNTESFKTLTITSQSDTEVVAKVPSDLVGFLAQHVTVAVHKGSLKSDNAVIDELLHPKLEVRTLKWDDPAVKTQKCPLEPAADYARCNNLECQVCSVQCDCSKFDWNTNPLATDAAIISYREHVNAEGPKPVEFTDTYLISLNNEWVIWDIDFAKDITLIGDNSEAKVTQPDYSQIAVEQSAKVEFTTKIVYNATVTYALYLEIRGPAGVPH